MVLGSLKVAVVSGRVTCSTMTCRCLYINVDDLKCCSLWYVYLVIVCCTAWASDRAAGDLPVHKGNKKIRLFEREDNSKESFAVLERE